MTRFEFKNARTPHVYVKPLNPRNTGCVRCGLMPSHPVHSSPKPEGPKAA